MQEYSEFFSLKDVTLDNRGRDVHARLTVTLEQAVRGLDEPLAVQSLGPATSTQPEPANKRARPGPCQVCNGNGSVVYRLDKDGLEDDELQVPCDACDGTGLEADPALSEPCAVAKVT